MTTEELRDLQAIKTAREGLSHAALTAAGGLGKVVVASTAIMTTGFVLASMAFVAGYAALGSSPLAELREKLQRR